jgi:hypothetical protein
MDAARGLSHAMCRLQEYMGTAGKAMNMAALQNCPCIGSIEFADTYHFSEWKKVVATPHYVEHELARSPRWR